MQYIIACAHGKCRTSATVVSPAVFGPHGMSAHPFALSSFAKHDQTHDAFVSGTQNVGFQAWQDPVMFIVVFISCLVISAASDMNTHHVCIPITVDCPAACDSLPLCDRMTKYPCCLHPHILVQISEICSLWSNLTPIGDNYAL